MQSWFKMERSIFSNGVINHDPEYFIVYCYLLSCAAFSPQSVMSGGKPVTLKIGQMITDRRKIADKTNVNENKVQRILKTFEKAQLIAQQTNNKNRMITVLFDRGSENFEQQLTHQMNIGSTSDEHQMHTYKRNNNYNNSRNKNNGHASAKENDFSAPSYDLEAFKKKALNLKYEKK